MKNLRFVRSLWLLLLLAPLASAQTADLPKVYDLRKSGGITPIKAQQGGTCWTHGTMAAIEGESAGQLEWLAVAGSGDAPCPDCEDNGLSGSQRPGEEFPTGHRYPPAHPGCRCLLSRTTT